MKKIIYFFLIVYVFINLSKIEAETIKFTNGDIIEAKIISKTEKSITIKTVNFGTLEIQKNRIKEMSSKDSNQTIKQDKQKKKIKIKKKIETGYKLTRGNNEERSVYLKGSIKRKSNNYETSVKASITQSSNNKKMNSQKWKIAGRHAYSFGSKKKWYNYYTLLADHSRFSNIDIRILPSTGIGYWFSDNYPLKAMVETALGYTYTKYNNGSKSSNALTIIPRLFIDYEIYKSASISEELIAYPVVNTSGDYRLESRTKLSCPINEKLSINLNFENDYNNNPKGDAKKLDQILSTTLSYNF